MSFVGRMAGGPRAAFLRGRRRVIVALWLGIVLLSAPTGSHGADTVRTSQGIGYGGQIVGLEPGGLVIDSGGTRKAVALREVNKIRSDAYPDLSEAEEEFASGDAARRWRTERVYAKYQRQDAPPWLKTWAQWRL